jgi:hypothetical protein
MEVQMSKLSFLPLLCCALLGTSCGTNRAGAADVNRPLAEAQFASAAGYDTFRPAIWNFSRSHNFAVQELITRPQGNLDFNIVLFRDDISLSVSRLHGDKVQLAALPLCVCELNRRIGLQEAADAAVNELAKALSR